MPRNQSLLRQSDRDALQNLVDAVAPVLAAHRSTATRVSEDEITQAWAAYDAARAMLRSSATTEAQRARTRRRALPLSELDLRIVASLVEVPGQTGGDIARRLDLPGKGIGGRLSSLVKRGQIYRSEAGYWYAVRDGQEEDRR